MLLDHLIPKNRLILPGIPRNALLAKASKLEGVVFSIYKVVRDANNRVVDLFTSPI